MRFRVYIRRPPRYIEPYLFQNALIVPCNFSGLGLVVCKYSYPVPYCPPDPHTVPDSKPIWSFFPFSLSINPNGMLTTDSLIFCQTLLLRAQIRYRARKRESPTSPMSDALFKFVGQLDIAWHAGDGVRSLRPSLSSHLKSPLLQTRPPFHAQPQTSPRPLCARIPLTSPWAPLLTELDGRLSWEGRKWLVKEEELSKMKRGKKHLVYQFTANLTRLPAMPHWHVRFPLFLPLFHSFLVRLVKVYDRRDITRKHTLINYCPTPKSVKTSKLSRGKG